MPVAYTESRMIISKSDYMLFLKHPAWLWVKKNDPSKIPPVDDATQAMFDAGHAFEPYAESLFGDGQAVVWDKGDWQSYRTLPARTMAALEGGAKVLFQGRFEWSSFTFLPGIVEVTEGKTLHLYEIKSSTRVKPEHIYDLAFQKVVLENLGFKVEQTTVIHANNKYVRRGEVDAEGLTTFVDVTSEVDEIALKTPQYMQAALKTATQLEMPDPNPELARLGSKADWLKVYENIFPPEPKVWPEGTRPVINKPEVSRFLEQLQYPLYFFDYETMQGLVPYFDGQRPYQQIPFQYSLHIIREPGGEVEHKEYLHRDNSDPARPLTQQLVEDIGTTGSVLVWYQSFEKSRNTELGEMLPEYKDAMKALNERIVDLMVPFKSKWYNDPRFEGGASIKKVLPVVCPELSYDELGIQDGNSAQRYWMEAVLDGTRADQKEQILADLTEYCKLDTWAMVRIWQELLKV